MNYRCKVGVEISKTDNGWVLEWKDETKDDGNHMNSISSSYRKPIPTAGLEVHTSKKDLMKRIEALIG